MLEEYWRYSLREWNAMTFKGARYESILEIERLLIVARATKKAYEFELKCKRMQCERISASEVEVKLNIQNKFIEELEELEENLLEDMDKIADNLNDIEAKVFHAKFIVGKTNQEIMDELAISETTLKRYYNKISEAMNTDYGEEFKNMVFTD